MVSPPFLFVYGTLLRGLRDDLLRRVGAKFVAMGTIQGRLYDLGRYPGAKPSPEPEDRVYGEVHRLPDPKTSLALLDKYEGIPSEAPVKGGFVREVVGVTVEGGRRLHAWAYLYNRPVSDGKLIAGGDYKHAHRPA